MTSDPLRSASFRASEAAAGAMLGDVASLRALLATVEARQAPEADVATRVHLDIAEAIVDAHIEELSEPGLCPRLARALANDPRRRVVVAALHYAGTRPWEPVQDEPDELEVLRRATDLARSEVEAPHQPARSGP